MVSAQSWPPSVAAVLPSGGSARLVGRAWVPGAGPTVVTVRDGVVVDLGDEIATVRDLTEAAHPVERLDRTHGVSLGTIAELVSNTPPDTRSVERPWLLSPIDLHVVKASGVTFAVSLLERIIEERAKGDPSAAAAIRSEVESVVGSTLSTLTPGSAEAARLKEHFVDRGWWSQYLEVGIGADAEIFTKAPVLSTVGGLVDVGVLATSEWSNPEPELVLVVSSRGEIVGATLGNDVNLRDVEGRSALLLGKAKDNNASAALGPFIRLFDEGYSLDDVLSAEVSLTIEGTDGFVLTDRNDMRQLTRDPRDLVAQTIGAHHGYPDGFVLYLGTMFTPTADRGAEGAGFTHHADDVVTISTPTLGSLVNRVRPAHLVEPWTFGIADLHRSLMARRRV
ncbi:MAG: fumarylacetoacetate hydrolase family protein [Microbacterium sp.]